MKKKEMIIEKLKNENDDIHILFVCSGNIIRSAYSEILLEKMLQDKYGKTNIVTESGALVYNNDSIHFKTKRALLEKGVPKERIKRHKPKHIDYYREMFNKADIIFGYSNSHIEELKDFEDKSFLIWDFAFGEKKEIADAWFTGQFEESFAQIDQCLEKILEIFKNNGIIKKK
ncbi:MAG: arsenate reductase/protein-tyrosine-phosphatase family protein [Candidatus Helarchaeota archaeon]